MKNGRQLSVVYHKYRQLKIMPPHPLGDGQFLQDNI